MGHGKQLCVLLVIGGDSPERDVSIESGRSIREALRELGHRVFLVDPLHPDIKPSEDPAAVFENAAIHDRPPPLPNDRIAARQGFLRVLGQHLNLSCDLVFNGLHGGAGEDGTFQAVLDYLGVRYTGSGAPACAAAMNKELSKRLAAHANVPVAAQIYVDSLAHEAVVIDQQIRECLSLPVVVKPNNEGSSVGVTIVQTRDELTEAIERAKDYGGPYLVEKFIPGREVTAAVLDRVELPLLEIRPREGFYDYRNKYQSGSCEYLVPAPLDEDVTRAVSASALSAYRALGCRGYARIDFRITETGAHYFLEANALPGLTAHSLFPRAAKGAGIDYVELIDRIVRFALASER